MASSPAVFRVSDVARVAFRTGRVSQPLDTCLEPPFESTIQIQLPAFVPAALVRGLYFSRKGGEHAITLLGNRRIDIARLSRWPQRDRFGDFAPSANCEFA